MKNYYFFYVKSNKYDIGEVLLTIAEERYMSTKEHIEFIKKEMLSKGFLKRADLYVSSYMKGEAYIDNIIKANISIYRCLERDIKKERRNEIIRTIKKCFGLM